MRKRLRRSLLKVATALSPLLCAAQSSPPRAEIVIGGPGTFPENLTSTRDGTIIVGSVGLGGILKASAGASVATQWIAPGDNGLLDTFGVLADDGSDTLWVCSSRMDPPLASEPPAEPAVYRYDLRTGAFRSRHPLPGGTGLCNDIAIGPDKAAYIADTTGRRVLRLEAGRRDMEQWSTAPELAGADGLDFIGAHLFVNSFTSGKLVRIPLLPDGSAGPVVTMKTSRPLNRPDGMRRAGLNRLVLAEGTGSIDLLTVMGDTVHVRTLRSGLTGPAGVTIVDDVVWALEAKLSLRGERGADGAPFKAYAIPLHDR